jgi:hypothetical protein
MEYLRFEITAESTEHTFLRTLRAIAIYSLLAALLYFALCNASLESIYPSSKPSRHGRRAGWLSLCRYLAGRGYSS